MINKPSRVRSSWKSLDYSILWMSNVECWILNIDFLEIEIYLSRWLSGWKLRFVIFVYWVVPGRCFVAISLRLKASLNMTTGFWQPDSLCSIFIQNSLFNIPFYLMTWIENSIYMSHPFSAYYFESTLPGLADSGRSSTENFFTFSCNIRCTFTVSYKYEELLRVVNDHKWI